MAKIIKDVDVSGISVVTNKHTPAVPKAEAKYAIFKIHEGRVHKLRKFFNLDAPQEEARVKKTKELITKLEDGDYLDVAMG